jgi:hypothetical protein
MIPKKPAPDLIRGVQQFSESMPSCLTREIMLEQQTSQRAKAGCADVALPATDQAATF